MESDSAESHASSRGRWSVNGMRGLLSYLRRINPLADWQLKLGATVLAVFLWVLATMSGTENIRLPVDLRITGLRPDLMVMEKSAEKIDVTVVGTSKVINALTSDQIKFSLDLSGIRGPEERAMMILPEYFSSPPGTEVVSVKPSSVALRIANKSVVAVPVNLQLKGRIAPDFMMVSKVVEPDVIQLRGPESLLRDVKEVETEPVSVEGANQPFTSRAYLIPVHPLVSFLEHESVLVKIDVRERVRTLKLYSVPIQQIPPERPVTIVPPKINVDITGPVSVLREVREEDVVGVVDVMDLGEGTYLRTPRLSIPEGTSVKSRDPDKVTIIVKREGSTGD